MPGFHGFYINLDRNTARAAEMSRQLAETGLAERYQRLPAIDGSSVAAGHATELDPGNLGLWLSHERLTFANRSSPLHLHILEDDALLPKDAAASFSDLLAQADAEHPDWDILFTEIYVELNINLFQMILKLKEEQRRGGGVKLYSARGYPFACTSSLFINAKSIDKYFRLIEGKWVKATPIDLYLRAAIQQGALNAYATLPFVTSLSDQTSDSDIRGELDLSRRVMNVYRRSLFKDADERQLAEEMRRLTAGAKLSPIAECYLDAVKFVLSDQWVHF